MKEPSIWQHLIGQYRKRHALTQAEFAERFSVSQQTVSRWEAGIQSPGPSVQAELRSVVGLTGLSNAAAWEARVRDSYGIEALFDTDWRILAVSRSMLELGDAKLEDATGKTLDQLALFREPATLLAKVALFDGAMRVLKVHVEFDTGAAQLLHDIDLWPILTSDDRLLVHAAAYPAGRRAAEGGARGVRLIRAERVLLDGRTVLFNEKALAL
jgi:transcriptional regulator with XRE-family HTH domain